MKYFFLIFFIDSPAFLKKRERKEEMREKGERKKKEMKERHEKKDEYVTSK